MPANETAPRLRGKYETEIIPALMQEFSYKNVMQVPRLVKIVCNMGVGAGREDAKHVTDAAEDLGRICGQKAKITKARKSISNFKLRQGMSIGACVTLRRERMWEFLDRLVSLALPRIRDFRGLPAKGFDGRGNYALGLKEQTVFAEIDPDRVSRIQGLNIVIVTTAGSDPEALSLLRKLGLPLQEK
ncbi:MAG: 50S ribosomal protein L5 [Fimbriimonadaceae bacterium]|nr:50S ribosomal protein L5 [Fimbriimonadaceae bacterium]